MVLFQEINDIRHDVLPPTVTRLPTRYPAVSRGNPVRAPDRSALFRSRDEQRVSVRPAHLDPDWMKATRTGQEWPHGLDPARPALPSGARAGGVRAGLRGPGAGSRG